ncbi:MAG: hypothetical protein WBV94_16990 [Blastocatellia bacterium]
MTKARDTVRRNLAVSRFCLPENNQIRYCDAVKLFKQRGIFDELDFRGGLLRSRHQFIHQLNGPDYSLWPWLEISGCVVRIAPDPVA